MADPTTNTTPPPALTPKRHRIKQWLLYFFGFFVLGWLITVVVAWPASNVSKEQREALVSRVNEFNYFDLSRRLHIRQKITKEPGEDTSGNRVEEYYVSGYTLFGIRLEKAALDCWDARPGIDGVTSPSGIEAIGSLKAGIWCDGIS